MIVYDIFLRAKFSLYVEGYVVNANCAPEGI
jgi:hypothetical protein